MISYNINLFKSCTPTTDGEKHTIFIMYDQDDKDFENKESKSFSCFAIRDEEAFSVLDKNFYLYTGEGEAELSHYSFDHEKICDMAAFTIAKSSIDTLGKEICVAKILSDMFFWGVYPKDREKNINKLEKKISKRRIAYIDEIRKEMDVKIEVYVMYPSNKRWIENSKKREDIENIEVYENQKKQMEFPNPAEGFDAIFEVVDDEIILRMDDIKPEIVKQARQELTEEDTWIRREDEREHKHRQLME